MPRGISPAISERAKVSQITQYPAPMIMVEGRDLYPLDPRRDLVILGMIKPIHPTKPEYEITLAVRRTAMNKMK